ncbi:hypothetical protein FNJ87_18435 [Nonlabens mediterrranea]|uniref:Uncharacterized protein n=1 Tax=Nonlabens mediterrranea TaxID=1419947 RepID=A0ABS0A9Y3_9FLAO|nr:hypothetical protein [Nonlabens mediterrranea]
MQLDYNNMGNEFGELIDSLSNKELLKFTEHKNPILRTFAKIGIINRGKGNILVLLEDELSKNETIEVWEADLVDRQTTASIVYEAYLIKKSLDTLSHFPNLKYPSMDSIIVSEKVFEKIDSAIIYSNCDLNYRILNRVFKRQFEGRHLSRIEKLAFEMNISQAFFHLKDRNDVFFTSLEQDYFKRKFPRLSFETYNEKGHLIQYLIYLLESQDKILYNIGLRKLRKKEWQNHEFDIVLHEIIDEKGIKL